MLQKKISPKLKKLKTELGKKDAEKKKEAQKVLEQTNGKEYLIKKLSTENKELYGSVKPTEIAKLIFDKDKVDIKPSMIQPINEIKSLGKFKVKNCFTLRGRLNNYYKCSHCRNYSVIIQFFPQQIFFIFNF